MIQIRNKNLDTERQALDIDRDLEYARLAQERELELKRAAQRTDRGLEVRDPWNTLLVLSETGSEGASASE